MPNSQGKIRYRAHTIPITASLRRAMSDSQLKTHSIDACLDWLGWAGSEADATISLPDVLQAVARSASASYGWLVPLDTSVPEAVYAPDGAKRPAPPVSERHHPALQSGEVVRLSADFIGGTVGLPVRGADSLRGIMVLAWHAARQRPAEARLHQLAIGLRQVVERLVAAQQYGRPPVDVPGVHHWYWRRGTQTFRKHEQSAEDWEPQPLRQMAGAARATLRELLRTSQPGDVIDRRFRLALADGDGHARWQGLATPDGANGIVTVEQDAADADQGLAAGDLDGVDGLLVQRFVRTGESWTLESISAALAMRLGRGQRDLHAPGTVEALIHPDDLAPLMRTRRQQQPGGSYSLRYRIRNRNNDWLHFVEQGVCQQRPDGGEYLVAICTDLTDEQRARAALRDGEQRFRGLLDDAPAMICRYRADYTITYVNQACAEQFGLTPEVMQGRSWRDFLPEAAREAHLRRLSTMTESEPVVRYEINEEMPDQRQRWYVWTDRGFFSANGLLEEVQSVGHDNTSLRETQEQLIQAGKMAALGVMATGVAHELNQPLNVMRLTIRNTRSRIGRGEIDPDAILAKLERMEDQVGRASEIVDNIRRFGRVSGREPSAFELNAAVSEAVDMAEPELVRHRIALDLRLGRDLPLVFGHREQLEQVLINLMLNAKDAILANRPTDVDADSIAGEVRIDTQPGSGSGLRVRVQDSGGGIPEALLPRIFEPFFTTKEVGKGTGLGLSISYGMISDMGGQLSACNVGRGAEFQIELPPANESQEGGTAP